MDIGHRVLPRVLLERNGVVQRITARRLSWIGCFLAGAWCGGDVVFPVHAVEKASAESLPTDEDVRHFETRVAPVLARHCLECHGARSRKARLDLSRRDTALAGGNSGAALVPGKAEESLIWHYVEADEMPPDNRPRLSDQEKELLRAWIEAGAAWSAEAIGAPPFSDERIEKHQEFDCDEGERDPGPAPLRRLTVPEYIETVRSALGVEIEQEARRLLPPDLRADGFSNTAYNLNVDLANIEAYAELSRIIVRRMNVAEFAGQFSRSRALSPDSLQELIAGMGKWLLRTPLEAHEVAAYVSIALSVAQEGGRYDEAVGYVLEAMLQSPRFLYLIEDQRGDGAPRRINDYELAARLSYILWGGPPDRELMWAADAGELSQPGGVETQALRMLEDSRAIVRSNQFIREWLNLDQLDNLRPNREKFPAWDEQLAADMRDETLAFFQHVAWEQGRPLSDLMNAQVTFLTPRLAKHYGLDPQDRLASEPARGQHAERRAASTSVSRATQGLQILYTFEEGSGDKVRDVSQQGEPVDLRIADPGSVAWSEDGLTVTSSTLILGEDSPESLVSELHRSNAITLEAWVTPANIAQEGPARIFTLSSGVSARNFTLGQDKNRFDVRLRTTATSDSGTPSLSGASGSASSSLTHLVYVRDAAGLAVLYVNGRESNRQEVGGDLSNWDGAFRLALANEISSDRPWLGTLHLAAVYDRALSVDEIWRNHAAGARPGRPIARGAASSVSPSLGGSRATDALVALYRFDEGAGDIVHDRAGAGRTLDLKIHDPSGVTWESGGLRVDGSTLIATAGAPTRLIQAIKESREVTLEAWLTPADTSQSGPARILTLSSGISGRNFTLGQEGDRYEVRFRTTTTDPNGVNRRIVGPSGVVEPGRMMHVVYTRVSTGTGILYVDGEERAGDTVDGTLANWDESFRLAVGNELSQDRPWRGTLHQVAIHSRALTADEIRSRSQRLARYDLASVPARGGLLTQGSTLTAGGDEASMVARGLFILQDILSSGVDDPPPCVDTTQPPTTEGLSQRGLAEARLADSSCVGCHARFEPLAFGLEKFNGIGAFLEMDEHGNRLRDDGQIVFPNQDEPISYQTSAELMDILAGSERIRQTITLKLTQFALGRPLVKTDACALAEIHEAGWGNGGTYASLITAIVTSDLVQWIRTEPEP
jgi:hypothetical protein